MRCEGWRRLGGVFTFGIPKWYQCKNKATVMLTVLQKDKPRTTLPACQTCWSEALESLTVKVLKATPIKPAVTSNKQKRKDK